jgi:hypothetical protein
MWNWVLKLALLSILATGSAARDEDEPPADSPEGVRLSHVKAELSVKYGEAEGLPTQDILQVATTPGGEVYAGTAKGLFHLVGSRWHAVEGVPEAPITLLASSGEGLLAGVEGSLYRLGQASPQKVAEIPANTTCLAAGKAILLGSDEGLFELVDGKWSPVDVLMNLLGPEKEIRQVAVGLTGETAVAAAAGLFIRDVTGQWRAEYPRQGDRSWAPYDVRCVAYDGQGHLWFASPQGAGFFDEEWQLFTGEEGLPYNDFTSMAAGPGESVWFGTRIGAIHFTGKIWEYRQGPRWLPDDEIRSAAVSLDGRAWFATSAGVGLLEKRAMSLAEKARLFEEQIDKYHRRTPYGYIHSSILSEPGDLSQVKQRDSDNDGLWTAMYGAGECFAYAATHDPFYQKRAKATFEALRFLSLVTQGGEHPALPGFPARCILPTSGENPNETLYTVVRDEWHQSFRDPSWKIIHPRWPKSADGQWYWKCDTSSDELDGHYFFYAAYYDLVAATEEEKQRVREVVCSITDHLLAHDYQLVDWDGQPTRWARFSPALMNHDPHWRDERGLNSLSMLSYLMVAQHISGDEKYRTAYRKLIEEEHYAMNMQVPKIHVGPGSGNHSDDEMALMSLYDLAKYEEDPDLRALYIEPLYRYWLLEKPELNPFFTYICAVGCQGQRVQGPLGFSGDAPDHTALAEAADTLIRIPVDQVTWPHKNSHRLDVMPLWEHAREGRVLRGMRRNGKVLPADERFFEYWNHNPWTLDYRGNGRILATGSAFLLPYYMGLHYGFLSEE